MSGSDFGSFDFGISPFESAISGAPYPPGPVTGSNAIGLFGIGVSPIGSIPSFNPWDTIISQYANSLPITDLIEGWFQALDQTANFDLFYDNIFNVATAQGIGLDIWGRIVGVNRVIQVATGSYMGFEEASGTGITPFGQAPWYSGQGTTTNYALSDDAFRTLIYAKALSNITDGSIPSLNNILLTLLPGRGRCYVVDGEDMTMTYTFDFALTPVEQSIVYQTGVLPQPTGVTVNISVSP
jgi:hypothetical protein